MLSMFSRKPKAKSRRNTTYVDGAEVTTENAELQQSNSSHLSQNEKHCKSASGQLKKSKIRANSASPHPVYSTRRTPGTSVTFESTLPTQVWQASPSPSPPLPLDSNTRRMNQRMVSSLSDNWVEKPESSTTPSRDHRLRGRSNSNSFHSWIADMDAEDSSDETNHSGQSNALLSSCSSSDESLTGTDRPGECKTSSSTTTVTTDSTSSLDLRMVSNSDGNLVQSLASAMTRRHSAGQQNQYRKKDRSGQSARKCMSEKKRRNLTAHVISSSSSSSDDDLEALGWDERTISAITNRNKTRQIAVLRQSTTTQNLSTKFHRQPKEHPTIDILTRKVASSCSGQNTNVCIPLQPLTPIQMDYRTAYVGTAVNHPQSCVLSRRAHKMVGGQQTEYLIQSTQNQATGMENHSMHTLHAAAGHGSDLLAVITADYKPLLKWEEQYQVIPVRKGDYVCVLSRPMKSRTWIGVSSSKRTGRVCVNEKTADDANTWLYVRRWCVDHLVATGPPGFVPRNHCRLLSSSELIRLWHHNQVMRTNRMHTGAPSSSSTDANPNMKTALSCTRPPAEHDSFHDSCMRTYNSVDTPSPSTNSSVSIENKFSYVAQRSDFQRCQFAYPTRSPCLNYPQIPPPPPGFGSGGSLGSETEDRDSGRGPSSGSEWGSGQGGSSSVTLDQSTVEKTASDTGIERRTLSNMERTRNAKSAEESQLGWYAADGSVWSSEPGSSHRDDGIYSHDSALQSPNDNSDLTPQLLNRNTTNSVTEANEQQTSTQMIHSSPLTLTTRSSCTPVLEMRPAGTPTLYTPGMPVNILLGTDSLATSTTCATVIETRLGSEPEGLATEQLTDTADPTYWEPYQTVIHVNENSLEKFTLV
ncbi:hypothetical protein FGIG_00289 [Fasciola gigantica]|uniref:Uncharacterized protein n=1 Tax=Fasciola gigantica TaxID=46835 RepID=A0A504WSN9_FASGI|nr:hypothetical protein FGIG_00289 [Fasciola gigantica]